MTALVTGSHTEAVEATSRIMNPTVASALFCAVLCSCYVSCIAYEYRDCGSTVGKFTNIKIMGCKTTNAECHLQRGRYGTMSIDFEPNQNITAVYVRAYGVFDRPIPYELDKPNACLDSNSGVNCPLVKDQKYRYKTTILVNRIYPPVACDVQWELLNEDLEKIVCVSFPVRLSKTFKIDEDPMFSLH